MEITRCEECGEEVKSLIWEVGNAMVYDCPKCCIRFVKKKCGGNKTNGT